MTQEIDFNSEFQEKQLHNTFKFKCVKGCKMCCEENDIILYPFDVMELCNHLEISSTYFHKKYTIFRFDNTSKILRCYLKTSPTCIFFNPKDACTIYDFRPVRCKLFPLARMFNEDGTIQYYLPKNKCIGFDSKQKYTIKSWLNDCDINEFEPLIQKWNSYIIELKNKPESVLQDKFFIMFFQKIFYDFDNDLAETNPDTSDLAKKTNKKDIVQRMSLQYKIAEIFLDNIDEWKEVYKRMDEIENK
jgi:Fe-S-cluster containining protein